MSTATTTAPEFSIIGTGEPTDAAIEALARLLLALVERDAREVEPTEEPR